LTAASSKENQYDWTAQSGYQARPRYPQDRIAIASVISSSLWVFWLGSLVGFVLSIIALARHRKMPEPSASRRWAMTALGLSMLGCGSLEIRPIQNHFRDSAAQASLIDLANVLQANQLSGSFTFPYSSGGAPTWTLSDGSNVKIVAPGTESRNFKTVSAEVWDWSPTQSSLFNSSCGLTVYAAAMSATGACEYMLESGTPKFAFSIPSRNEPCTADIARDVSTWGTTAKPAR